MDYEIGKEYQVTNEVKDEEIPSKIIGQKVEVVDYHKYSGNLVVKDNKGELYFIPASKAYIS